MSKKFPVMLNYYERKELSHLACPTSVPWAFVEQFEHTVKYFHDQTLERLAQRGGLGPCELMAAITNRKAWWKEPEEKAVVALKTAVDEFNKRIEKTELKRCVVSFRKQVLALIDDWERSGNSVKHLKFRIQTMHFDSPHEERGGKNGTEPRHQEVRGTD